MKSIIRLGILFSVLMLAGCEQARIDAQMAELCAKDGGMKVYETVALPKEAFTEYGDPKLFVTWNEVGGGYFFASKREYIKNTAPTLQKISSSIIRQMDKKILGTHVAYLRRGGDILPHPGPDSAKICPEGANETLFIRAVFVKVD